MIDLNEFDDTQLDLSSVDRILCTARSIRRKLDFDKPVPMAVLKQCINIATQAPVGIEENWRFLLVSDAGKKRQVADAYRSALYEIVDKGLELKPTQKALVDNLHRMPVMAIVCAQGQTAAELGGQTIAGQVAFYGSVLPAAWSFMLALRARNIGCTWTTLLSSRQAEVASILNIPADVIQTVMLPIAPMKGATLKVASRQPAEAITYLDDWGTGLNGDHIGN